MNWFQKRSAKLGSQDYLDPEIDPARGVRPLNRKPLLFAALLVSAVCVVAVIGIVARSQKRAAQAANPERLEDRVPESNERVVDALVADLPLGKIPPEPEPEPESEPVPEPVPVPAIGFEPPSEPPVPESVSEPELLMEQFPGYRAAPAATAERRRDAAGPSWFPDYTPAGRPGFAAAPLRVAVESDRLAAARPEPQDSPERPPPAAEEPGEALAAYRDRVEDGLAIHPFAVQSPPAPLEVKAGSVINATLLTGINSDLPGRIIAQVNTSVYDTLSGDYLLIPQGSRLLGRYEDNQQYGDTRVGVFWSRLLFPNGDSLSLEEMEGIDTEGYAGVKDRVRRHYGRIYSSVVLLSAVSAGVSLAVQPRERVPEAAAALPGYAQPSIQQTLGQELALNTGRALNRQLQQSVDIQPTIVVRPGKKLAVMVVKDLTFERPYPRRLPPPAAPESPVYFDPTQGIYRP